MTTVAISTNGPCKKMDASIVDQSAQVIPSRVENIRIGWNYITTVPAIVTMDTLWFQDYVKNGQSEKLPVNPSRWWYTVPWIPVEGFPWIVPVTQPANVWLSFDPAATFWFIMELSVTPRCTRALVPMAKHSPPSALLWQDSSHGWELGRGCFHPMKYRPNGQGLWAAWPSHMGKSHLKVKVCRRLGNVTPAKFWLNSNPNVEVCRLLGNVRPA